MGWLPHIVSTVVWRHPVWTRSPEGGAAVRKVVEQEAVEPLRGSKSLGIDPETLLLISLPVHSASCSHVFSTMSPSPGCCFCQGVFLQEQKSNSSRGSWAKVYSYIRVTQIPSRGSWAKVKVLHQWAESPIVCAWGNCLQRIKWRQTNMLAITPTHEGTQKNNPSPSGNFNP